jgi:hypothetical protein
MILNHAHFYIVCAGSGGSVLQDVDADLYWTGEMSHVSLCHSVLNETDFRDSMRSLQQSPEGQASSFVSLHLSP